MAHYTFPAASADSLSGVTLPELVQEGQGTCYSFDDATTEGIMFHVPNVPSLSGDMTFDILGYASGTTGSGTFVITPFDYTPSDATTDGSWLGKAFGTALPDISVSASTDTPFQISRRTVTYTPATTMTDDYFGFKLERDGADGGDTAVGDFRILSVTLTF